MNERLVTVRNFGDPQEASIAKGILDDHGIPSYVQGGQTATTLFHVGTALGGVNLQVPEETAEQAAELLDEHLYPAETVPKWTCPKCGAHVDAGYETCWQCSTPYSEDALPARIPSEDESQTSSPDEPDEREYPGDEIVDRAWKAIILGILIAPLLFYALYLIGEARNAGLSERGRRKLFRTQVVAYSMAVFVILVAIYLTV